MGFSDKDRLMHKRVPVDDNLKHQAATPAHMRHLRVGHMALPRELRRIYLISGLRFDRVTVDA